MQSHPLATSNLKISPVERSAERARFSRPNDASAKQFVPPAFNGTIVSACESAGISLEDFIEKVRLTRMNDLGVARFLDTWDTLSASEQQAKGAADAVCEKIGLAPVELLKIVAAVTCRISMYSAQIIVALSHPLIVEKTIERALTDEGIADRTMLHKATGFLPTPKGSQTTISIMQNAHANAAAQSGAVVAPPPEQTIRRLVDRFNEARGLPHTPPRVLPEVAIGVALPISIPENGDAVPVEVPEEEENDGE